MKVNYPLLALAVGAFGIGTTEFSPMGLLPTIAKGVDVSIPMAGMLISAYAVGVMVGAPLMTLLLSHRARRSALIFLMAIFTGQRAVGHRAGLHYPDAVAHHHQPEPRRVLWPRIGGGRQRGAERETGQRRGDHVYGADHRQYRRGARRDRLGETIGWRMSFPATAGLGVIAMLGLWFSLPQGSRRAP